MSDTASQVRIKFTGVRICLRVNTVILKTFVTIPKMQTNMEMQPWQAAYVCANTKRSPPEALWFSFMTSSQLAAENLKRQQSGQNQNDRNAHYGRSTSLFYESRLIGYPLKNFRTPCLNQIIGHESFVCKMQVQNNGRITSKVFLVLLLIKWEISAVLPCPAREINHNASLDTV